jgi:sulfoxide reductase heme-binding subunit YedZ
MLPWTDYRGRLSALKLCVFILLFVPGMWTLAAYILDALGPRPLNEAIHQFGLWTIRFMYISLLVTPARQILQWNQLAIVRRMIGVAAFCYGVVHLLLYITDQEFDLVKVGSEIVLRFYLAIGISALLGLTALAATSTDGMARRLGGRRWQRLHQTLYAIGILATIHYFIQSKLDVFEPMVFAGFYGWLMFYRIVAHRRRDHRVPAWAVGILALLCSGLTAAGEALYFFVKMSVDPSRVLLANLTTAAGLRPAWFVLGTAAVVTAAAFLRPLLKRQVKLGLRAA